MVLKVWLKHSLLHWLGSHEECKLLSLYQKPVHRNSVGGVQLYVFKKPSRQFLHTLKFENYCSINAGYFQTNFLIFLYFNVKLTINGQRSVFKVK